MKKKINLKDLTKEQYEELLDEICTNKPCSSCPLDKIGCSLVRFWMNNKDLGSEFLNQEIEVEVPDLLTKEEQNRLEFVISHRCKNKQKKGKK